MRRTTDGKNAGSRGAGRGWLKIALVVLIPLVLLAVVVELLMGPGSCFGKKEQVPREFSHPEKPGPGWGK